MSVFQASTVGIHLWYIVYTRNFGKKRTMRRSKPMEVKVVKLSAPHVMRVLSFPTPERTPRTTVNATESAWSQREICLKPSHAIAVHLTVATRRYAVANVVILDLDKP